MGVEDLVMAAATIQAAQIQANYNLWAMLGSSIVGASGIIYAAWYAWQSGIKLHQHNNMLEAKREVYLDAIAKYQHLVNDLQLINIIPDKFIEILLNNNRDFFIAINKVKLICHQENKHLVDSFSLRVVNEIHLLMPLISEFIAKEREANTYLKKYKEYVSTEFNQADRSAVNELEAKEVVLKELGEEFRSVKEKLEQAVCQIATTLEVESESFADALRGELKGS